MIHSAGIVVLRIEDGRCLFLLLRSHSYWDFPKGEVDDGEETFDAALREVREESGLTDLDFRWGKVFIESGPYRTGHHRKIARYYLALTPQREIHMSINPDLGRPEHDEYRWATRGQAERLLGPRLQPVLEWAARTAGCD